MSLPHRHVHSLVRTLTARTLKRARLKVQSKEEDNNQESIQLSTTPDPGQHMVKWQQHMNHHIQESQEVSSFAEGDHKAAMNRQDSMTETKHKL